MLSFLFETINFGLRACFVTENSLGFFCVLEQVQESEKKKCLAAIPLFHVLTLYVQMKSNIVSERGKLTESICRLVKQNLEINLLS